MNHGEALMTKATERYLLGEMTEPERFDFEGHYFTCEACAEDVRKGFVLTDGMRAVFAEDATADAHGFVNREKVEKEKGGRGWFAGILSGWLSPGHLIPAAAAAVLAVVAGYQALVVIPPLREATLAQAVEPVVLRAVARGEEPVVTLDRKNGLSVLLMDVNDGEAGQKIGYELLPPGESGSSGAMIGGTARVPKPGTPLVIVLQDSKLQHPGLWTLVLRTPQGTEAGRYPFRIEMGR